VHGLSRLIVPWPFGIVVAGVAHRFLLGLAAALRLLLFLLGRLRLVVHGSSSR
jgi:hypothetical protein